ncbi:hypothetical protein PybrP1_002795 [[Pythium] brassicae (nom. inval.)]|nr:hypothetical protein PybrP1_002795 [[Pythium] brassicae (nom. inval.)]
MADASDGSSSGASAANAALLSLTGCVRTLAQSDVRYAQCAMNSGLFALFEPTQQQVDDGYRSPNETLALTVWREALQEQDASLAFGECQLLCSRPTIFASTSCCNAVARLHACQPSAGVGSGADAAVVACKQVIDQTFAFQQHQCDALTTANAGLVAAVAVVALVVGGASASGASGTGDDGSSSSADATAATTTATSARRDRGNSKVDVDALCRRNDRQEHEHSDGQGQQQHHQQLQYSHHAESDDLEARFGAASAGATTTSSTTSSTTTTAGRWQAFLATQRQVSNLVWKNLLLRRRKPVALVLEQLLPLLLVGALVVLANLDALFGSSSYLSDTTTEARWPPSVSVRGVASADNANAAATTTPATLVCTSLYSLSAEELGAPNGTLRSFYTSGQSVLGLFFLVSYVKFVSSTTTAMVIEKENRLREVMKIMGVSDAALLWSWCVTGAALSTPLALAVAALLKFGRVFPGEEFATLAFLFWSLSLAIGSFSYCVTPLFRKSRTAAIVSVLLWLLLFFPFFAVQPKANAAKYWAALCPPTAFALGVDHILRRAQLGLGFAYSIAAVQTPVDVPTAAAMGAFLVLDSALLVLVGWYLEQVLPQQYGVRKPLNFFLKPHERGDTASLLPHSLENVVTPRDGGVYVQFKDDNDAHAPDRVALEQRDLSEGSVEPVSAALLAQEASGACLQLRGLRKVFKATGGEEHVAVEGLTLAMYEGQITALLGHNGAGKTTTIAMLTGLFPPTSGDATLHGRSIRRDFDDLRRVIGVCPQHDVLFQELTVEEHLQLFGTMKRVAPARLQREVDAMVEDVGLTDARHVRAKHLSGGQKRKLSVALAFIGDSKLVFLDEPTSGMDPYSRRFTWNLLQKNRAGRVIVLTTHFMDEADILGDRIAILADGRLCCAGSSLFLKSRYGAGYNLTLIKAGGGGSGGGAADGAGSSCDVSAVGALLRRFVPGAKCLSDFGSEVVFQLPTASSSAFPAMLEALDAAMAPLHVAQYGISVTTLEEVFLRISRDRDDASALAGLSGASRLSRASATQQTLRYSRAMSRTASQTASQTPTQSSFVQEPPTQEQQQPRRSWLGVAVATGEKTPEAPSPLSLSSPLSSPLSSSRTPTFWSQYAALTTKRFQIARRDKKTLLHSVCIPLLFLGVLAALPTIEVASFIPDYATTMASEVQQLSCPAQNITAAVLQGRNLTSCLGSGGFGYCTLGVVDCDPQVCCNAANYNSPLYPCNTCVSSASSPLLAAVAARAPCFNRVCMKRNDAKLQVTMNAFLVAVVVMLGFAFIPASIVAFVVREKDPAQDAKSLQLISGANVSAYWFASWTHDAAVGAVAVLAAAVVVPLSTRSLRGPDEAAAVALLVALHVLASIPVAYLFSFRFSKHAVAQTSLLVFALGSGGLLSIFSFMCRVIDFRLSATLTLSALDRNYLRWLFLLFPGYSLNNGLFEIAARRVSRRSLFGAGRWSSAGTTASFFGLFEGLGKPACRECWDRLSRDCCVRQVFDLDVGGAPIAYLAAEAVVLTLLVFYLERRKLAWAARSERSGERAVPPAADEDADVALERRRVETTPPSGADSVFIRNLHHEYGGASKKTKKKTAALATRGVGESAREKTPPRGKVALKNLSLAIPRGECFGYLGINGAGKSTTMKVLTGTLAPTDGFVMLGPHDLASDRDGARRLIGYCPQFDALHDLLTVTEQLSLYARLKGVGGSGTSTSESKAQVRAAVDAMIERVGLAQYRDTLTRALSGGNKRKVSTAIALIGSPPVVFLDEPSTGVDPSSRRKMWDVIASVCAQGGASVVLTTHSMEECEALCSRVGIMVSGALRCLGSVEHLKQTFGQGFTVEVKLREPAADAVERVRAAVLRVLLEQQECGSVAVVVDDVDGGGGGGGAGDRNGVDYEGDNSADSVALHAPFSSHTNADSSSTTLNNNSRNDARVTLANVACVCAALGDAGRGERILSGEGSAWVVHNLLGTSSAGGVAGVGGSGERGVSADVLSAWWVSESRGEALRTFFCTEFPGSALVEQQGEHFRFQVPKHALRPSAIFALLESAKTSLHVSEYGVSDTSLEHIFNGMAAQQEEERGVVRGMY